MTNFMERLIENYREELETYRKSLKMMESGELHTGEKTLEHPQWRDTTLESIAHAKRVIAEYEDILERHKNRS